MAIMPGASRVQTFSGNRHKAPITKIVLHTTEGSSWPGYGGGGSAPHFTVHRDGTIRQHIDTAYSAKALVNRSGGVETNNGGCIQIEFIGSCDRAYAKKHKLFFTETATDKDLAGLAKVLAWINRTHGVPLTATGLRWPTTNAAYASAPQRMSYSRWNSYKGVLGHTHVPENDHWDPGNFPITRLLALAKGGAVVSGPAGGANVPKPSAKPAPRPTAGKLAVDGRWGTATSKELQGRLGVTRDGRAGVGTWKGLQRKLGHPVVDGLIENQSYRHSELGNGIAPRGWEFTGRGSKGSPTIRRLQSKLGVPADGIVGAGTVKALQRKLNADKNFLR